MNVPLISIVFIFLSLDQCMGQIIDLGGIWEINCPEACTCGIQKFIDLPLHEWIHPNEIDRQKSLNQFNSELLKVATCIIADDSDELFKKLPSDVQILTILESGNGDIEISLNSATFERFTELLSMDIQGINYENPTRTNRIDKMEKIHKGGIVLTTDALYPLGTSLLYLNLERVELTSSNSTNENKANLIIKPMGNVAATRDYRDKGHRLIFLSQQNNGDNEDKEILPYDVYKQVMDGYRENVDLFTGLKVLTHLRVYDCSLKDISWHMFDGLDNLVYLSLENNHLKFIPEFCFYGTPNLKSLSLAGNELLTLKSVDLAGLLDLEDLDLKNNNLTFLSELSFPPFPMLKVADFYGNPLDSVFPSTFEIMNTTRELYLGAGIGSTKLILQKNSLLGLRLLEKLHLYNFESAVLERFVLQGMPILKELKIRGNVSSIDFDAFVDLAELMDLDLSCCHIQRISMDAFYGLEKIQRIDLSNNEIKYIPPGLFAIQQQKELKDIVLTKNQLTSLPWEFFKNLRLSTRQPSPIQNIRLDDNPWDCSCAMANWNPNLVNRMKETAPRCSTPKHLRNWGIFQALRKGGLDCKNVKKRYHVRRRSRTMNYENSNFIA